jgi:HD-GYP domain-containing protein (c-di-GMP phosphodiesterase class II)
LHDIGKIGIRDNVLLKPGRLTEKERSLIEEHPRIGINIVQYVDLADEVKQLVLSHHEKLDGTGYPEGLQGEQISIFARIGAVADIYDALTTERPYKPGLAVEEAVALLKREAKGGRLDERVVIALISALKKAGVEFRACGQAVVGRKIDAKDVNPDIQIDLWAMTSFMNLQMKGFVRTGN